MLCDFYVTSCVRLFLLLLPAVATLQCYNCRGCILIDLALQVLLLVAVAHVDVGLNLVAIFCLLWSKIRASHSAIVPFRNVFEQILASRD